MVSCSSVFAFMLLIVALVACAVSFSTPFWVENKEEGANYGLWQVCGRLNSSCETLDKHDVDTWFNMVRAMYAVTLILLVLDLFYAICYFTCNCCKTYKAVQFLVLDLILVLLASMIALLTFGIKSNDQPNMPVHFDHGDLRFGWSYYVALSSLCATILTLILYVCEIPNARRVAAYEPIRPTTTS